MTTEINLKTEILDPLKNQWFAALNVSLPGVVSSYSRTTFLGAVTWAAPQRVGPTQIEDEPAHPGAPVYRPGGDGYGMHFDLVEGDLCIGLIGDGPQSSFWKNGEPSAPTIQCSHNLGNAMLLPGGRLAKDGPPNAKGTLLVGANDGSSRTVYKKRGVVEPASTELTSEGAGSITTVDGERVNVGAAAASQLLKGTELVAAIDSVLSAGAGAALPNDGGAAALAAMITAWNGLKTSTLSTKGFVE